MIEWRHQHRSCFFRQFPRNCFAIVLQTVVENDFCAISFRRFQFRLWSVGWHCDLCANTKLTRRNRDGLSMVPGRERDNAAAAIARRDGKEKVRGPSNFESSAALQVLALEEAFDARRFIERAVISSPASGESSGSILAAADRTSASVIAAIAF